MRAFFSNQKKAELTNAFKQLVSRLVHVVAWKSPASRGSKKYLTVKRIADPTGNTPDYYYSERLGTDSIAFICHDSTKQKPWLILRQWHGPLARFNYGTFTGSLDKPGADLLTILSEELKEEAGIYLTVSELEQRATFKGKCVVGGNTNEQVNLYVVDITGVEFEIRQPENIFEQNLQMFFCDTNFILKHCEWKAQLCTHQP